LKISLSPENRIFSLISRGSEVYNSHIFYAALRGGRLDLASFEEKLVSLSEEQIDAFLTPVPEEWRKDNDLCEQIATYLREARKQGGHLMNFVRHILQ
jgi:hypothetical protein